jgi:RNA polymerase sigma-70 factor (ECF subfamily)
MDNRRMVSVIRDLVCHLPKAQRIVFTLRDLQDLSVDEVQEVTGMSKDTIKANLCHARKRIRELLERTSQATRRQA